MNPWNRLHHILTLALQADSPIVAKQFMQQAYGLAEVMASPDRLKPIAIKHPRTCPTEDRERLVNHCTD